MVKLPKPLLAAALTLIAGIFAVEGGYVNDPHDPGGETNHGVTIGVARKSGYNEPMRELTRSQAEQIYFDGYVAPFLGVLEESAPTAEEVVDTGVNTGPARAARWFQESLNHLNNDGRDYADVTADGQIGPATMAAYAALRRKRGDELACVLLIRLMDAKQAAHYMRLQERFMVGWVRTRVGNVPTSHCPGRPS